MEQQPENSSPPNRRELKGPRPSPLKVRGGSHKISKRAPIPPGPKPITQQPLPATGNQPVIIYSVSPKPIFEDPSNFRSVVQDLTGNQSTSSESAAFSGDLLVSPAARYASIERTSPSERDRREKRGDEVHEMMMMMINNDNSSSNNNYNINSSNSNSNNDGMQGVSMGQNPGILSPAPANLPAISAAMFSPKFNQQITTSSSAATHTEASFHRVPKTWRSKSWAFELGGLPEEKDAFFNSIFQGKSITNKLNRFEFDSLAKLVLNIMRWKKRASARLNLDFNVGKKVDESGSLAQFNNNLINVSPLNWWSRRNLSLERSGLLEKKDAGFNSLAIFQEKSKTRTPTFQLRELALSRHGNRKLITMEDQTMDDLLQEEYIVAESPCTLFRIDPYVQDMDADFYSSPLLDQIPFEFDAMIVDDALFYCALFPPDHEFEKDTLVQVWMALGIFVDEPMERFGSLLFKDCLTKGYFQFLRTNLITGKAMYKFIQKTQSLPLSIGSHINLSMVSPEVTYASIRCCDLKDFTALLGFQRFKQLRALIFLHGLELSSKQVPRNFFLSLSELRVLDLSKTRLMELPTSIGNMKCLCLLDLSDTLIKRLPEAIGCLEKLQTLKLKGCLNISTLPKGMRKLTNLRHLDFDVFRQLRSMPEGMGDLSKIQTLSAFLVGVEDGCSIRQIKNMNNLSGSFCISRLENVLTKDEAEEACLSNKAQLKKIELHWSDSQDEDVVGYEEVLSSLRPNTSLEELNISCYGGLELPSWICDPIFSQLVCITLFECENCLVLPSLGQIPSLKYLNIVNFHKLKVIDHKFYGDLGIQGYVAFPKLEKLTVESMSNLEEWSGIRSSDLPCLLNLTVKHCPKLLNLCTISSLCSLQNLEISHCAVLASCPDGKLPAGLETFIIEGCPLISARISNGGQDWQMVAHIPHIWIDHKET